MAKIFIVQKDLKTIRSGAVRLVRSMVNSFVAEQHQVSIVTENISSTTSSLLYGSVVRTFRWPFKGFFRRWLFKWQAERILEGQPHCLVIGHGDIVEQHICFMHNCVHLEHEIIHGSPLPRTHDVGRIHAQILAEKKFEVLVCNSQLMKADLVGRYSLNDRRVEVIYPCFDELGFSGTQKNLRPQCAIDEEAVVVGLVTSGAFEKRNVGLFLEVLSQIDTDKKLHIIVAGNGSKDRYQDLISKTRHPISFLPSSDRVMDYYAMLDVFVLPAHIEEFGMSALEAMYFSKPVVLNHQVGAAEVLEGESRNFILPELNAQQLEDKVIQLIDDEALRLRVGEINRRTAKKYTSTEQSKKLLALVGSIEV